MHVVVSVRISVRMWSVCTELLQCMHGACIMCTAMHATVRVRKFVVNKISNGPGNYFLRAPIQIMTPSNRSHPTPTSQRQGSMLPGGQALRASARAVEFRTDRIDRTNYARLESAARARSCLCAALARPLGVKTDLCYTARYTGSNRYTSSTPCDAAAV